MKIEIALKDDALFLQGKNFGQALSLDDWLELFPFHYRTVIIESRTPWGEKEVVSHFVFDSLGIRLSGREPGNNIIDIIAASLSYRKGEVRDASLQTERLFDGSIQIKQDHYEVPIPMAAATKYYSRIGSMHFKDLACYFLCLDDKIDYFLIFFPKYAGKVYGSIPAKAR